MRASIFFFVFLVLQSSAQITLTDTNEAATTTKADYLTGSEATFVSLTGTSTRTTTSIYETLNAGTASSGAANSTSQSGTNKSTSATRTLLVGGQQTTSATTRNSTALHNNTSSSTFSSDQPTNTQPCNGYSEFCERKYSNITYVAAHNSPFVRAGNAASNQVLDVTTQLEDGIRMLQFQVHNLNGTLELCHTSCQLLDVGTLEGYLATVTTWLSVNPYEVITILIGNYDYLQVDPFADLIQNSGLIDYVYTPPQVPMGLADWPTTAEMILLNQRAVVMMDYNANQTAVPYILNELDQMWETPFSPTDQAFPCTQQRPPHQSRATSEDRMYMANHNLNVEVSVAGISLDVPAFNILNVTNAVSGYGSVGVAAKNCSQMWNRPPNFLLVDFYNIGNFNGSVFQVAATANNVTYNRNSCCGTVATSDAALCGIRGVASALVRSVIALFAIGIVML